MTDAFQPDAFQADAFQLQLVDDAFQCGAFQGDAFQTCVEEPPAVVPITAAGSGDNSKHRRVNDLQDIEDLAEIYWMFLRKAA